MTARDWKLDGVVWFQANKEVDWRLQTAVRPVALPSLRAAFPVRRDGAEVAWAWLQRVGKEQDQRVVVQLQLLLEQLDRGGVRTDDRGVEGRFEQLVVDLTLHGRAQAFEIDVARQRSGRKRASLRLRIPAGEGRDVGLDAYPDILQHHGAEGAVVLSGKKRDTGEERHQVFEINADPAFEEMAIAQDAPQQFGRIRRFAAGVAKGNFAGVERSIDRVVQGLALAQFGMANLFTVPGVPAHLGDLTVVPIPTVGRAERKMKIHVIADPEMLPAHDPGRHGKGCARGIHPVQQVLENAMRRNSRAKKRQIDRGDRENRRGDGIGSRHQRWSEDGSGLEPGQGIRRSRFALAGREPLCWTLVVQPLANPSVLDISLADEIFTARTTEDADQLRSLIADLRADVLPRIAALQANVGNADLAAVKRELHQIRGVIANFALSAAAARLRELEGSWAQLGPAERRQKLDSIDRDVQAGLLALTARFSFLAT